MSQAEIDLAVWISRVIEQEGLGEVFGERKRPAADLRAGLSEGGVQSETSVEDRQDYRSIRRLHSADADYMSTARHPEPLNSSHGTIAGISPIQGLPVRLV